MTVVSFKFWGWNLCFGGPPPQCRAPLRWMILRCGDVISLGERYMILFVRGQRGTWYRVTKLISVSTEMKDHPAKATTKLALHQTISSFYIEPDKTKRPLSACKCPIFLGLPAVHSSSASELGIQQTVRNSLPSFQWITRKSLKDELQSEARRIKGIDLKGTRKVVGNQISSLKL